MPAQYRATCLVGTLMGLTILLLTTNAQAQGLDRLDAHNPPDLTQAASDGGILGWLEENTTLLLVCFGIMGALLVAYWVLNQSTNTKRLQRDALEKLRKSLIESSKATRGPAKTVWLTGSPRDPPARLGRYVGHHRSVDAVWIAYRTWLFGSRRLLCTNATDLNGLDVSEIHVRAIGLSVTRGLGYAVPDVHNAAQRADWQSSVGTRIATPEAFSGAWKSYYAHAVDNAIAFYDAMNAAEDRSFLRQEVTRSQDEITDTLVAPAPSAPQSEEGTANA